MKLLKTVLPILTVLLTVALVSEQAEAQDFEGVIHYEFPSNPNAQSNEMSYMVKGKQVRMEMGQGNQSAAMIYNTENSEMIVMIPQMKGYMKTNMNQNMGSGDQQSDKWEGSSMEETGQTKTIAGHTCEVWKVENADGVQYSVCMTKGLGSYMAFGNPITKQNAPAWARKIADQNYMPLEVIQIEGGNEKVQMRATKIEEKSLDDSLFKVPEGYRDMSGMMKQMQNQK